MNKQQRNQFHSILFYFAAAFIILVGIESCKRGNPLAYVKTNDATDVTDTSAYLNGTIEKYDGAQPDEIGFRYSTSQSDLVKGDGKLVKTTMIAPTFGVKIDNLIPNRTYYFLAFTTKDSYLSVGNIVNFTTTGNLKVSTKQVHSITHNSAIAGGTLVSNGGVAITEKGVCYSTNPNPTITDAKVVVPGTALGSYNVTLTGLATSTTYYVKAYATNSLGISYGAQDTFTTKGSPVVATISIDSITQNSAIVWGNLISDGGIAISQKGVCYSTTPNPTTANPKVSISDTAFGNYSVKLSTLTAGTIYYVRAYAINVAGTSYGVQDSFTTKGSPFVVTNPIDSITQNSALAGGNLVSDGGITISQKGVCYSTNPNPTIASAKLIVPGTALGSFDAKITGLTARKLYYVRAYATNSVGTSYGAEISFTTTGSPIVTTNAVNTITQNSAIAGGNLVSDGGVLISEKGVCYSTSPNPTIASAKVAVLGSALGSFDASLTGLAAGKKYYAKAYAINSVGTSYGSEVSFTTAVNNNANYLGTFTMLGNDSLSVTNNDIVITANGTSDIVIGNFGNYTTPINVDATLNASQIMTIPTQMQGGVYIISAGTGSISPDFKTITVNYTVDSAGWVQTPTQIYLRK